MIERLGASSMSFRSNQMVPVRQAYENIMNKNMSQEAATNTVNNKTPSNSPSMQGKKLDIIA